MQPPAKSSPDFAVIFKASYFYVKKIWRRKWK